MLKIYSFLVSTLLLMSVFTQSCSNNQRNQETESTATGPASPAEPRPSEEAPATSEPFSSTLTLQGIRFQIEATNEGSLNTLRIAPDGLEIDNQKVEREIDGIVTNAEIEDLNSDGSPEVLIYVTSAGSGSYGTVIGYSVNNKKSMSEIYFPGIADNPEANQGYMGHDEFAIVETTLAQRFPVYQEGDSNSEPTGNIRQIQWKLVDGEASRLFKVDKIVEFPRE